MGVRLRAERGWLNVKDGWRDLDNSVCDDGVILIYFSSCRVEPRQNGGRATATLGAQPQAGRPRRVVCSAAAAGDPKSKQKALAVKKVQPPPWN